MEMFGCSIREIGQRFTKSELVLMAWRSREQAAAFEKRMDKPSHPGRRKKDDHDDVPDQFRNEEGELDMRKMTGDQAYRFFQSRGIRLPIMQRSQ